MAKLHHIDKLLFMRNRQAGSTFGFAPPEPRPILQLEPLPLGRDLYV